MNKKTGLTLVLVILIVSIGFVSSFNFAGEPVSIVGVPNSNFMLEVSKGNVPGHTAINKFGQNPTADTGDDIWGGDGTYDFYPSTAQSMEILSTSASDDVGGTGAIQVLVQGLDSNWEEVTETVTLDGTTPVALQNQYIRMYRAYVVEAGSSNSNIGDITVEIVGSSTVAIFIGAGGGQTQHAIYTIPGGKTGYFVKGYVGLSNSNKNGEDGTFRWLLRLNNGLNGAWLTQGEVGLVNIGSSYWQYEYGVPAGPLPEKTDIRIELTTASATMDAVAGFDILLVDN